MQEHQNKEVLIIEDHADSAYLLSYVLESNRHGADVARTGRRALDLCRKKQYDLVIVDLNLPDYSGLELAKAIKKIPHYQTIPFLAYTAQSIWDASGGEDIFAEIVTKPVLPDTVQHVIGRWLQKKPAPHE